MCLCSTHLHLWPQSAYVRHKYETYTRNDYVCLWLTNVVIYDLRWFTVTFVNLPNLLTQHSHPVPPIPLLVPFYSQLDTTAAYSVLSYIVNFTRKKAPRASFTNMLYQIKWHGEVIATISLIASFMGPTWGPSGAERTQVGPMLAPWTLLSLMVCDYPSVP